MAAPGWYLPGVPIYEYACMECEQHFEELVRNEQQEIACPSCGAANVLKQLSTFSFKGSQPQATLGSGGCCGGSCGCGH